MAATLVSHLLPLRHILDMPQGQNGFNFWFRSWFSAPRYGVNCIFRVQSLQYELGNFKAISADVRINPDLTGYTWIEFYKPMEFIEKGAEAARQALPQIRQVISERLSAP